MKDERSDHAEQLCGSLRLCVRAKIISVNFPTGWSESKANRYSVISVCNQIREIHVIRGNKIINVIKQMKQFHLIGTDVRREKT